MRKGEWFMAIDKTLIDRLLKDYKCPEEMIWENGLLKQLTKAVLERALEAESPASSWRGQRYFALPLPSRTHPQNQNQTSAVYTEELADLGNQPFDSHFSDEKIRHLREAVRLICSPRLHPVLRRRVGPVCRFRQ